MADILIRMEMPKGCKSCKLSSDCHCNATGEWLFSTDLLRSGFNWKTCRLENCPLHELPEHGDLIDRDAFIDLLPFGDIEHDVKIWRTAAIADAIFLAHKTPVVIPSNKEETE